MLEVPFNVTLSGASKNALRHSGEHGSNATRFYIYAMKAHQLFLAISPELKNEIILHLDTQHRPAYNMVMNELAKLRKMRPVFLERKTQSDQHTWLIDQLRMKSNNGLAEQVIQLWLLKSQQDMLKTFLDAVGIEHKDGEVENLPEEIADDKAASGVAALLASYPADKVAVYLHMFQLQRAEGWPSVAKAIEAEPKLSLNAGA